MKTWFLACCLTLNAIFGSGIAERQFLHNAGNNDVPGKTPPITEGQRVFTAGHSFHTFIAPMLSEMASSAGINGHRAVGVAFIGGSTVLQHWDTPGLQNKVKQALISGQVDVLTVSPIWLPDEGIEKFAALGLQYNPKIRITVQEFWLPNDTYNPVYPLDEKRKVDHNAANMPELRINYYSYFRAMDDYVNEVNHHLGKNAVFIVPVGQATMALREKIVTGQAPDLDTQAELFTDSWGHPTAPLKVLSAYCHFAVIYRRTPVGLPMPPELQGKYRNEKLNLLLQELAWEAVIHHPMTGLSTKANPPERIPKYEEAGNLSNPFHHALSNKIMSPSDDVYNPISKEAICRHKLSSAHSSF
jgi:hypothetical protein